MRVSLTILALSTFFLVHCSDGEDPDSGTTTDLGADAGVGDADAGPDTDGGDAALDAQPDGGPDAEADGGPDAEADGGPDAEADSGEDGSVDASDGGPGDLGPPDLGGVGGTAACLGLEEAAPRKELSVDWYGRPAQAGGDVELVTVNGNGTVLLYRTSDSQFLPFALNEPENFSLTLTIEPSRHRLAYDALSLVDATGRYFGDAARVWDRQTDDVYDVCLADDETPASTGCGAPSMSDRGERVAFLSNASNLVAGGTGHLTVYVRDRLAETTTRVGHPISGAPTALPEPPQLSRDGRRVIFRSAATNLIANDGNGVADLFAYDLVNQVLTRANTNALGEEANAAATGVYAVSANGEEVVFYSQATNLDPNDNDGVGNVFIKNLVSGAIERLPPTMNPCDWGVLMATSADARFVVTCDLGDSVRVYDRQVGAEIASVPVPILSLQKAFISDDGSTVFVEADQKVFASLTPAAQGAAPITCPGPLPDVPAEWQWKSTGAQRFAFFPWPPSLTRIGDQVIIWGVSANPPFSYDRVANTYQLFEVPGAVVAGRGHSAVWTGTELIVFGGYGTAGLSPTPIAVDPVAYTTRPLSLTNAPALRYLHAAAWTGTEMLIFGGQDGNGLIGDGGAYDPATDTWRALPSADAPSARSWPISVYTGTEWIVYGGAAGADADNTGARYNPTTNQWTPISTTGAVPAWGGAWTGTELFVWNGFTGGLYNPATDTWRPTAAGGPADDSPEADLYPHRFYRMAVRDDWVIVMGEDHAAAYSLSLDQWTPLAYPPNLPDLSECPLPLIDLDEDLFLWCFRGARFGPLP